MQILTKSHTLLCRHTIVLEPEDLNSPLEYLCRQVLNLVKGNDRINIDGEELFCERNGQVSYSYGWHTYDAEDEIRKILVNVLSKITPASV